MTPTWRTLPLFAASPGSAANPPDAADPLAEPLIVDPDSARREIARFYRHRTRATTPYACVPTRHRAPVAKYPTRQPAPLIGRLGRHERAQRSRALGTAVRDSGWDEACVRAVLFTLDPAQLARFP